MRGKVLSNLFGFRRKAPKNEEKATDREKGLYRSTVRVNRDLIKIYSTETKFLFKARHELHKSQKSLRALHYKQ